MTTKKTAAKKIMTPRPAAPQATPAENKTVKTFERSAPVAHNMRLTPLPSPSGRGVGGDHGPRSAAERGGELPVDPDSSASVAASATPVNPRDLILRLVETLKGL